VYFDVGPGIRIRFWWLVDVAAAVVLSASGDIKVQCKYFAGFTATPTFACGCRIF